MTPEKVYTPDDPQFWRNHPTRLTAADGTFYNPSETVNNIASGAITPAQIADGYYTMAGGRAPDLETIRAYVANRRDEKRPTVTRITLAFQYRGSNYEATFNFQRPRASCLVVGKGLKSVSHPETQARSGEEWSLLNATPGEVAREITTKYNFPIENVPYLAVKDMLDNPTFTEAMEDFFHRTKG
jgi:hypothetical protein